MKSVYNLLKPLIVLCLCCSLVFSPFIGVIGAKSIENDTDFSMVYVNSVSGNDNNIGTSPESAKKTIQNATKIVKDQGKIILKGTFTGPGNIGLDIDKNVTFEGSNAILDAQNKERILSITQDVTINFTNITFVNGKSNNGGAIYNTGSLIIRQCTFNNNNAETGGAIYNNKETGIVTSLGCTFTNNHAKKGSVIENLGSYITFNFNRIIPNKNDIKNTICNDNNDTEYSCQVNALDNWWGDNNNPTQYTHGDIDISTWLILSITTEEPRIYPNEPTTIIADIHTDNFGHRNKAFSDWFQGATATFKTTIQSENSNTTETINPTIQSLEDGKITTIFTPHSNFTNTTITATLDNQTASFTITFSTPRIYVSPEGDNNNNGLSPDTAKRTIQNAVNSIPTNGEIYLGPGLYDEIEDYNITINRNMSIIGEPYSLTIDPEEKGHIFLITNNAQVKLEGLTLRRAINDIPNNTGAAIIITDKSNTKETSCTINQCEIIYNRGSGISNEAKCIITNSKITDNYANTNGGAIHNKGICTITDTNLTDNRAAKEGGAIYTTGKCNINQCILTGNNAQNGGGISVTNLSPEISIDNTNITNNIAQNGGALYNEGTNCNLNNNIITDNEAQDNGGGIYNHPTNTNFKQHTFNLKNSVFTENQGNEGGAIYNTGKNSIFNIINTSFTENNAVNGTICSANAGILNILASTFTKNNAQNGGGIINTNYCNITNTNFTENNAQGDNSTAGAILNINNGTLDITNTNFTANNAEHGGAILNQGSCNINHAILTENAVENGEGGAILNQDKMSVQNSLIKGNNAFNGGGIYNELTGDLKLVNSHITQNNAKNSGGGIYNQGTLSQDRSTSITGNKPNDIIPLFIYVSTDGSDYNDGLRPETAKRTIQNAIKHAKDGNIIKVAPGTYDENLKINKNIILKGNNAKDTIINGEKDLGISIGANIVTIKGFTITNAKGECGGAIHTEEADLTVEDSIITKNRANYEGSGIWSRGGKLHIINTTLTENTCQPDNPIAVTSGGGIEALMECVVTIENSTITNNIATWGGGISTCCCKLNILNSTISKNTADGADGGGLRISWTDATISNSIITNNTARFDGGGIYICYGPGLLDIKNTIIMDNKPNNIGEHKYSTNFQDTLKLTDTTLHIPSKLEHYSPLTHHP